MSPVHVGSSVPEGLLDLRLIPPEASWLTRVPTRNKRCSHGDGGSPYKALHDAELSQVDRILLEAPATVWGTPDELSPAGTAAVTPQQQARERGGKRVASPLPLLLALACCPCLLLAPESPCPAAGAAAAGQRLPSCCACCGSHPAAAAAPAAAGDPPG